MKKTNKKEEVKQQEANITDLVKDWNKNHDYYSNCFGVNLGFNDFLIFCAEKYTILPK